MLTVKDFTLTTSCMKPVTFSINPNESVQLVGANGRGKTTLLSMIAGLETNRCSCTLLEFDSEDLSPLPIHQRVQKGIVLMHQHPVTFKKLTLKELLSTPIFDNETKQSYISSLELDQHLDKPLHSVSGGESKRVECLLTLALHPRLLLLDEPDSGTDIHSTALIGKLLSDYQYRTGASILYVTHSKNISTWIKPSSSINLNSYYE